MRQLEQTLGVVENIDQTSRQLKEALESGKTIIVTTLQKFPVIAGLGRRDRTTMFVSRGVGTVYVPIRINCPPEVAVLTLQPAAS